MPTINLEALDDLPIFDQAPDFSGGQVSSQRANLLQPNQYAFAENMDIYPFGLIRTRRGTKKVGTGALGTGRIQGLAYFDKPGLELDIAVCNQNLYRWNGISWTLISGWTAINSTNRVEIVQGVNEVFISDGFQNLHSYNGTTVVNMGTGSPNPPIAKGLLWHTNRLFAYNVGNEDDAIYVSNILDATQWNYVTQQFRVGGGEGDPIVALLSWQGFSLAVLKRNSVWVVNADPTQTVANWSIERVTNKIGCVAKRSAVQVGNDIFFLSDTGVRTLQQSAASEQNIITEALSFPIQNIIERINWQHAHKSCATFYNNRYILTVPLDNAIEPDTTLVFNTQTKSWCGVWTGWSNQVYSVSYLGSQMRLIMGTTDGRVMQWRDHIPDNQADTTDYQDDGADYGSMIVTRAMMHNERAADKKGFVLECEFFESECLADIYAIFDSRQEELIVGDYPTFSLAAMLQINLIFYLGTLNLKRDNFDLMKFDPYREIQIKIIAQKEKLSLRNVIVSGFSDSMPTENPIADGL